MTLVVLAAACGSGGEQGTGTPTPEATPDAGPTPLGTTPSPLDTGPSPLDTRPAGRNDLPSVTVLDVASGESVDLRSLAPAPLPMLVWFWAPH